jgi:hypothetical protein
LENIHHVSCPDVGEFDGFLRDAVSISIENYRQVSLAPAVPTAWSAALANHSGLKDIACINVNWDSYTRMRVLIAYSAF